MSKKGRESAYQLPNMREKEIGTTNRSVKMLTECMTELGNQNRECGLWGSQIHWCEGMPENTAMGTTDKDKSTRDTELLTW